MGAEAAALHHHGHVAQNVMPPLLVQALQDVSAVYGRLEGEHRHALGLEWHGSLGLRSEEKAGGLHHWLQCDFRRFTSKMLIL